MEIVNHTSFEVETLPFSKGPNGGKILTVIIKGRITSYNVCYTKLLRHLAEAQLAAEIDATRLYGLLLRVRNGSGWSRDFSEDVLSLP